MRRSIDAYARRTPTPSGSRGEAAGRNPRVLGSWVADRGRERGRHEQARRLRRRLAAAADAVTLTGRWGDAAPPPAQPPTTFGFEVSGRGAATHLVVVADRLEFIDFTGVEVLALAARRVEERGGSLVVTGAG